MPGVPGQKGNSGQGAPCSGHRLHWDWERPAPLTGGPGPQEASYLGERATAARLSGTGLPQNAESQWEASQDPGV